VELIAAALTTKKLATLGSNSLLDLLKDKERYAGSKFLQHVSLDPIDWKLFDYNGKFIRRSTF
jgi:hypothetical protein